MAAVGLLLVGLAAIGRLNWLFGVAGAAFVLLQRVLTVTQIFDRFKQSRGTPRAKTSSVETQHLKVSLNHDTGEMSGQVIRGEFAGRTLEALSLVELSALFQECQGSDQQSVAVLETYLDRRFGKHWREGRERRGGAASSKSSSMSREEAIEILGVADHPSEAEIVEAHRRLIQKVHPDRGGSNYLAAKINQAKDVLINT
jgi:hypothetical protein